MSDGSFRIDMIKCRAAADELERLAAGMENVRERAQSASDGLRRISVYRTARTRLRNLAQQAEQEGRSVADMKRTLEECMGLYRQTENRIAGNAAGADAEFSAAGGAGEKAEDTGNKYIKDSSWWAKFKEWIGWGTPITLNEIDSIVFDEDGSYGGDQGAPVGQRGLGSEKEELYEICKDYYGEMTDEEYKAFMIKLNSEGCGYVAVINTIFAAYEGRETEFEEAFGFPMYSGKDLNYNKLLVDFYAATDNHNNGADGDYIDFKEDYFDEDPDEYNYKMDRSGVGTGQYSREYRTELYLKDKNTGITIQNNADVTVKNFAENYKDGYVIIAYHDGNLQNADGSTAQYIDGGHAMTVTGVTSDGRYIVSSWGERYYIDPNQTVERDGEKTNFNFAYYEY